MDPLAELSFPPLEIDIPNEQLWREGQSIRLRPKTFVILRYLAEHPGRLITKDELLRAVWGDTQVSEDGLRDYLREIRQALGDDADAPRFVETVRGRGYRFLTEVVSSQHSVVSRKTSEFGSQEVESSSPFFSSHHSALGIQHSALVGRDADLAHLYGWLKRALNGERQLLFVTGEPGIGKTTLLEAFRQELETRDWGLVPAPQASSLKPPASGVWLGWGQCIEQHGAGEAFLPILDALERLCRGSEGEHLIEVLRHHAPMWLAQLPAFVKTEELEALQRKVQGASRERMLRELTEALEVLTVEHSLVLVLEDLHWSDVSTLDFLAFLVRRKEPARLMIIGTYRPEAIYSEKHPLRSIVQELQAHRLCSELALAPLSESAIRVCLEAYFPTNAFPSAFTSVLRERTEGNPLFLSSLLETFVGRGIIDRRNTSWVLTQPLTALARETPESFRLLLERQIERLTVEEQQILAAGSVVGLEFSTATVAHALGKDIVAIEACCDSLSRRRQFLRLAGDREWPDGERTTGYAFLHALTREAWSERIPMAQKQRLHQSVGERLEAAYHGAEREIATELAMHFAAGHDEQRAIQYHQIAGEKATKQLAYHEAISHYSSALSLLPLLPDSRASASLELQLQLALTEPLIAVKGWAAPETQQAYSRAHALSRTSGDLPEQFLALSGLWVVAYTRADLRAAHDLARQLMRLARWNRKDAFEMEAYHALGNTLHRMGDLRSAWTNLKRGISLSDRQRRDAPPLRHGLDIGVAGHGYASWVLWALGYPDQAQQQTESMLTLAQALAHPLHLAWALNSAAWHSHYQRAVHAASQYVNAELALCEEHHFTQLRAVGSIVQGWALASLGKHRQGICLMEEGLIAGEDTGAMIGQPRYLTVLAEAYGVAGESTKALDLLSRAEEIMAATEEFFYAAELHRLRGALLLNRKRTTRRTATICSSLSAAQDLAEESFEKARAIARRRQAKMWELRATVSLARLWQQQGKRHEARQILSPVYNWFTEGFDTKDLQEAKVLLEALH